MNGCQHLSTVGDNYGESCKDCKKARKGYGYGGYRTHELTGDEKCIHEWSGQYMGMEECNYCFEIREQRKNRRRKAA